MTCTACGAANPPTSRFCGACGAGLGGQPCPDCGTANPADHRFCGLCGSALAGTTPPTPVDERKLATVLFADVVGFTTLAETADPEAIARTVDGAFRRLAEVVADHGGTVDKYMGDSLMATFGVPTAHDDDAERAVAAGLAMRSIGGDLAFAIGINTGEVMVTSVGGDAITVIGDTVNVAARLEKVAGPGEVLVGPLTARLTGDRVVLRERGPVVVKGRQEPVDVCQAISLQDSAGAGTVDHRRPLVGRVHELAFLRAQWQRTARDRRAGVVLITGEAGVGTTRLIEELCDEVADEAHVVRTSYPAYGALGGPRVGADIVRQLGPTGDEEVDAKARSVAGELDPALRQINPATFRAEQVWAFRRLLEAKAAERPVLLILDDVHRAGDKTLELIQEVTARTDEHPVLLVLVGRPEPSGWLGRFAPVATTLRLDPLGPEDARQLAVSLVDDLPLSAETSQFLIRRSRGNALYLRELVALARERGQLVAVDGAYELSSSGGIPPSLQALLAARLDALAPDQKTALQHVALLGHAAGPDEVEALGLEGAGQALHLLERAGLLRRKGKEACFDIADPLLGEVAYETLPRHVRAGRHRRAADVAGDAEERARHLARAVEHRPDDEELRGEAATASAAAGLEVLDAYRHFDAIRLLRQAADLGDARPSTALRLAEVLTLVGRHEECVAVLDQLPANDEPVQEARRVHLRGSSTMFAKPADAVVLLEDAARRWAAVGNVNQEGWAFSNRAVALFSLGRLEEALEALHAALAKFDEVGDRSGQLAAYGFIGLIRPNDRRVPDWLDEGVRYSEQVGDRTRLLGSLVSLAWHRFVRFRLGGGVGVDEAEAAARRLLAIAEDLDHREFAVHGAVIAGNLARLVGRFDEAAALAERVRSLMEAGSAERHLGEAFLFTLELAEGRHALPPPRHGSPDPTVSMAAMLVAEALLLAGRPKEAVAIFTDWRDRPDLGVIETLGPGLTIAMGQVLAGATVEATEALQAALAAADDVPYGPYAAISRALLAETALADGDHVRARELVDALLPEPDLGISRALVLRARALLGDDRSRHELAQVAAALRAPGLAAGTRAQRLQRASPRR